MLFADVAELADALDLGSSVTDVGVQVPSSAPYKEYREKAFSFFPILLYMVPVEEVAEGIEVP